MYLACHPQEIDSKFIHAFEFCGYVITFVAIFFVCHGLYIIGLSLFSAKQYDRYHSTPISDVLIQMADTSGTLYEWIFSFRLLPFSSLRNVAEFKIIFALFRDTYWLPSDFNYGRYLSGCFEYYSLRIIKIGVSSWLLMITLAALNYIRVQYMGGVEVYNCKGFKHAHDSHNHGEDEKHDSSESGRYGVSTRCTELHLQFYFVCACAVTVYVCLVSLAGRMYILR
jgi:hypothetical protein